MTRVRVAGLMFRPHPHSNYILLCVHSASRVGVVCDCVYTLFIVVVQSYIVVYCFDNIRGWGILEWMGGWVDGWMGGWFMVDGWMVHGGWVDGSWWVVDGWIARSRWVGGWIGGWLGGSMMYIWMDKWMRS